MIQSEFFEIIAFIVIRCAQIPPQLFAQEEQNLD